MKLLTLWIFHAFTCELFSFGNSQTVECIYEDGFPFNLHTFYISIPYYTCRFGTINLPFGTLPARIEGVHKSGTNDDDVKYLINYDENQVLHTFSSIFCNKFRNLEAIVADNIKLEYVKEDSFWNCWNLQFLELTRNNFRQLPANLLIENINLALINIGGSSQLSSLSENFLINQINLESLQLPFSNFYTLPCGTLSQLINFGYELLIYDNKLLEVPKKCFQSLRYLRILLLYKNKISALHSDSFDGLENLEKLGLASNEISHLPQNVFIHLKNLQQLLLAFNRLMTIHSDSFGWLPKLWLIDISENLLNSIDEKIIDSTVVSEIWLNNNFCSNVTINDRNWIKPLLAKCFANYRPRVQMNTQQLSYIRQEINPPHIGMQNVFDHNSQVPFPPLNLEIFTRPPAQFPQQTRPQPRARPPIQFTQPSRPQTTQSTAQTTSTQKPAIQQHQQPTGSCGQSKNAKGNIIGGSFINKGEFPWLAVLTLPNGTYFCAGVLISNRKVVTAAHCIQEKGQAVARVPRDIFVSLGTHDLNIPVDPDRVTFAVENVDIHPNWNPNIKQWDADITVLYLARDVAFTDFIQPVCLIPAGSPAELEVTGTVVGYGKSEDITKLHENIPKVLDMPIITQEDCLFDNPLWAKVASRRTFCAGRKDMQGVCNGDSGGGLFVNHGGIFYLRGIVSSSLFDKTNNCDVDSYSLFTNVLKFNDWIESVGGSPHFYKK